MSFRYVIDNLVNESTLDSVSTEDTLYVMEWMYNQRPSKPFRFTAKSDQDITVQLGSGGQVTFAGIFNHNLQASATARLEANNADAWGAPAWSSAFTYRRYDEYQFLNQTYPWWRLYVDDDTNLELINIGEFVLGIWEAFTWAKVTPGRADGPAFTTTEVMTQYHQAWDYKLSRHGVLNLKFLNLHNKNAVDELETWLDEIYENCNRVVLIPDHAQPHVFYCRVANSEGFAQRVHYGEYDVREWTIDFEVLAKGITLL